jgi:multiple antibiotic resistance protein
MKFISLLPLFLLGFSSLLPLINPVGTALIINPYLTSSTFENRKKYSRTIVFYSFVLGISTIFLGSWFLKVMGISIPVIQMAGGIIVSSMGLSLLNTKSSADDNSLTEKIENSLFYPIAFPFTLGPGGISAIIALSAHAQTNDVTETFLNMVVLCISLLAALVHPISVILIQITFLEK